MKNQVGCLRCGEPRLLLRSLEPFEFCGPTCQRLFKWENCEHEFVAWKGGVWAQCGVCGAIKALKTGLT